jgi:3,4-dihydroxy 2-butanone 4-phosphate synthase/GTP cyclohydrolase II
LRAEHDGLLVGIGTVLTDDPRLTVRLVPGDQPQPVIVDTHLRTPVAARVLRHPRHPWIAAAEPFAAEPSRALRAAGAGLLGVRLQPDGRLDLAELLEILAGRGLTSLLVEGGSRILHSFLSNHLVDWVVVTVAPRFVAGRPALIGAPNGGLPGLRPAGMTPCGPDFLLWGEPSWPAV